MNATTITDAIDQLDPEHGSYLHETYEGNVSLSYCPEYQCTAIPMGYVYADDELAQLDPDDEADVLERLLAALGLTIDRKGKATYDPGDYPGVVRLILCHAHGELDDEALEASAVRLNQTLGEYLYATDPDERPEGAMELKDRLDAILGTRREEKENARANRYEMGTA